MGAMGYEECGVLDPRRLSSPMCMQGHSNSRINIRKILQYLFFGDKGEKRRGGTITFG